MANEHINNPEEHTEEHKSWLQKALEQADTDFPLSGGETDEDLDDGAEEDDAAEDTKDEHKSSFLDDLDTDFPLSGGEVEHD
jgi:hypothetical protein